MAENRCTVLNLKLLTLGADQPLIAREAVIDEPAIVVALSRSLGAIRNDVNKVALLQTLFGRRWNEVQEYLLTRDA